MGDGGRPVSHVTNFKPARGTHWLDGRKRRAERKAFEDAVIAEAKARDGHRCRVPWCEHMGKKPRLEGAHFIQHRGMGGDPSGGRTRRDLILTTCFIHHAEIDKARTLRVEPQTAQNADGPCDYLRENERGEWEIFGSERLIGVSETRGA